jgi:hypothetical protein
MTHIKDDKRVNLHLLPSVHARLKAWCYRNGMNLQDGLATMVDLCAREVNGLKVPKLAEPAPMTLARPVLTPAPREAMSQIARPPAAAPKPISVPEPPAETDDERFERERNELDPDALYARQLSRGETPEVAREQVKDWCSSYDVHEDWEPASDEEIH